MLLKSFVLSLVLFCSVLQSFANEYQTNAQRLANGLTPKRPRSFGHIVPGYAYSDKKPTHALRFRRSEPSSKPAITSYKGRIDVRTTSGQSLGYVRNRADASSISGIDALQDPSQEIIVEIMVQSTPTNIFVKNAAFPAPYFVGAAGKVNIGTGLRNTLAFTNVHSTPPGSQPVVSSSRSGDFVESAIWHIEPDTLELTAQYINPDGSKPSTIVVYDIRENSLFFVGDVAAYNTNNDTPASPVRLFLTPGN
ncbi:hypothetical protein APHAL10511_004273 [Amanita phalloides]|nr:hypothetical protein APHAL10511_004273 [Amanita phalloides]